MSRRPKLPTLDHGDFHLASIPEQSAADGIDCAVICTDHRVFDYAVMPGRFPLVVDTRNALKGCEAQNVFRL